jgi:hypothetical protein
LSEKGRRKKIVLEEKLTKGQKMAEKDQETEEY